MHPGDRHSTFFDVLTLGDRDVMGLPLRARRDMLERRILPDLVEPIRYSPELQAGLADLIASVRAQGLEGLVCKRRDSRYEPGRRSGAWQKMRIKQGPGVRHRRVHGGRRNRPRDLSGVS